MITIKEEFLKCDKLLRAFAKGGSEAVTLWLVMKGYAASKGSDGFVPREHVEEHPLVNRKKLKKSIQALEECGEMGRDGVREEGLVVLVESHGFELHDYLDHAQSSDELAEKRRREKDRKAAYRERCRLRVHLLDIGWTAEDVDRHTRDMSRDEVRAELSHVTPVPRDMSQPVPRDTDGTTRRDGDEDGPGVSLAPAPTDARADTHARAQAPQPNPTQPNPTPSLEERARKLAAAQAYEKNFLAPQTWPEVHWAAEVFCGELGWHTPRWSKCTKAAIRLGELFSEFAPEELERAAARAKHDDWLTRPNMGLHCLTLDKVRSLLSEGASFNPRKAGQPDYDGEEQVSFSQWRQL